MLLTALPLSPYHYAHFTGRDAEHILQGHTACQQQPVTDSCQQLLFVPLQDLMLLGLRVDFC